MKEVVIEGKSQFYRNFQPVIIFSFKCRDYDKRDNSNYKSSGGYNNNRHYESDDNSDSGGNNFSTEPNNKVIVRGLAQHITEADVN